MPNVSNNAIYEHDIKVLQKFGTNGIFIHKVVISGKKLTSVEAIHANECHKDDHNWDHLWGMQIPCCIILWRKMQMKQKNALMRISIMWKLLL